MPRAISSTIRHKSGAQTISHLRFGTEPIRAPYLIRHRRFRRLPPVRLPRRGWTCWARRAQGAHLPPQRAPCGRTRSGTGCRARCRSRSSTKQAASSSSSTQRKVARELGPRAAGQHDPADLLLRHLRRAAARRGDRRDQACHREEPMAARAARWSRKNFAAVDAALAASPR